MTPPKISGQWVATAGGDTALSLGDSEGKPLLELLVDATGKPRMSVGDEKGFERAVLGCAVTKNNLTSMKQRHPESSLFLFDKNNKVIFEAP